METTEATVVHFTVEGAFIVNFARDQVLSKDWRGALRTLKLAMTPAMSLDQAVEILSGKSTLVEDGQKMIFQPQDQNCAKLKRYLSTAHWQNAGILERDGEFYQPYAEIRSFNWQDAKPVLKRLEEDHDWMSVHAFQQARARHYMDLPFDDIACFDSGSHPVLFKRVQGPAFWQPTFTDTESAMTHWAEHRKGLEERGAGDHGVPFNSLDFYRAAAQAGYLSEADAMLPDDEYAILEQVLEMRAGFDDSPRTEDNPWRSDERIFDDAVEALVWKFKVDRVAEKNGGFFELKVKGYRKEHPESYRIALVPFLHWAKQYGYHDKNKGGALPEWTRVCPSGLKMQGDNPMHTDWFASSGLPFRAAYDHDHPINKAAWKQASMWQDTEGLKCLKLAGKGKVTGPIVFPKAGEGVFAGSIAVVSHAGPDYELALMSACKNDTGAVIAEVGGKLAHLAIVSRELGARLVVIDEALSKFKEGELVTLDLDTGEVKIHGRTDRFEHDDE
jgi:phosphohistidine swiveling domain-containing protein